MQKSAAVKAATAAFIARTAKSAGSKLLERAEDEVVELSKTKIAAWKAGTKSANLRRFTIKDTTLQPFITGLVSEHLVAPNTNAQVGALYDYVGASNKLVLKPTSGFSATVTVPSTGHKVNIKVTDQELKAVNTISQFATAANPAAISPPIAIEATCFTPEGGEAFLSYLKDCITTEESEKIAKRLVVKTALYDDGSVKPVRPLDSVFLDEDIASRLSTALEDFKNSKERFARMGRPYSLGILLHGPPGSGKSSLAQAIASSHTGQLYLCHIDSFQDDKNFSSFVGGATYSTILMEDLDVFKSVVSRDSSKGVSLSGLLNALDGPSTPHNSIFVITTNDVEALKDPALVRPGRIDLTLELGYATLGQVKAAAFAYTDVELVCKGYKVASDVPMSKVTDELFKVQQGESAMQTLIDAAILEKV